MILNGGLVAAALHVLEVGTKPGCLALKPSYHSLPAIPVWIRVHNVK